MLMLWMVPRVLTLIFCQIPASCLLLLLLCVRACPRRDVDGLDCPADEEEWEEWAELLLH